MSMGIGSKEKGADIEQAELVGMLIGELSKIAGEIEEIPVASGSMTNEQVVALQRIDFCRQRLLEVTKIMNKAFAESTPAALHDLHHILTDVGLEHTREVFLKSA